LAAMKRPCLFTAKVRRWGADRLFPAPSQGDLVEQARDARLAREARGEPAIAILDRGSGELSYFSLLPSYDISALLKSCKAVVMPSSPGLIFPFEPSRAPVPTGVKLAFEGPEPTRSSHL
jgi:hypothetical protein